MQGIEYRPIRDGEEDRVFAARSIGKPMPVPRRHVETIPLTPCRFNFSAPALADPRDTLAAHHVIDCVGGMPMRTCLLTRTEQLNPAAHRCRRRSAVLRIAVFQYRAVEWIARPGGS